MNYKLLDFEYGVLHYESFEKFCKTIAELLGYNYDIDKIIEIVESENNYQEFIDVLTNHEFDLFCHDCILLRIAIEYNYFLIAEKLIAHKQTDTDFSLVLCISVMYGRTKIIELFLDTGIPLNELRYLLYRYAAVYNQLEAMNTLYNFGLEIRGNLEQILSVCSNSNFIDMAKWITTLDIDLNIYAPMALSYAASANNYNMFELLVRNGIDFGKDNNKFAYFFRAIEFGSLGMVKLLVELGIDNDIIHMDNDLFLFMAIKDYHNDIAKYLIDTHPNFDEKLKNIFLGDAFRCRNEEMIKYLL